MKRSPDQVQRALSANLKTARLRMNLSQEALALAAEVDRTYVSQIERGIGNPSIRVVTKLAVCLGLDISDLLVARR